MANNEQFQVEVAYARPDVQVILTVDVDATTTLREAVERSGLLERFPEIELASARMGIFGKLAKPGDTLRPRDRIEIYRPLIADPKEVRKQRAAEGKRMKKGGGDVITDEGEAAD